MFSPSDHPKVLLKQFPSRGPRVWIFVNLPFFSSVFCLRSSYFGIRAAWPRSQIGWSPRSLIFTLTWSQPTPPKVFMFTLLWGSFHWEVLRLVQLTDHFMVELWEHWCLWSSFQWKRPSLEPILPLNPAARKPVITALVRTMSFGQRSTVNVFPVVWSWSSWHRLPLWPHVPISGVKKTIGGELHEWNITISRSLSVVP